jgi:hypothetical protein
LEPSSIGEKSLTRACEGSSFAMTDRGPSRGDTLYGLSRGRALGLEPRASSDLSICSESFKKDSETFRQASEPFQKSVNFFPILAENLTR